MSTVISPARRPPIAWIFPSVAASVTDPSAIGSGALTLASGSMQTSSTTGLLLTNAVTLSNSNVTFAGSNPLRFLKQFAEYGLHGKLAVLGNTTSTDEGVLRQMGEEAVGVYTAGWYAAGLDTPDNRKFVAAINADDGHDPGFYTAGPYTALLIVEQALKATSGDAGGEPFLKALHEVRLDHGPIGPVRLDDYGTPVLDIYIRRVERQGGKLVNAILKTYPQVSQFWTYDPAEFVKQPPFSRDYPPSKYLE